MASKRRWKSLYYRVSWVGYPEDLNWYLAGQFIHAPEKLRQYHLANPEQDGPPIGLPKWLAAQQHEIDDYDPIIDNRLITLGQKDS